ncbi:hypothetical protein IHE26_07780 [Plesiomonas shigelloides]|uniref:hypothetical protein n=1 Tax=Plesiomonas shigelloides TaxID=703 RepID=UPI00177C9C21|nr:hypothetical protein [Plesiomonas shigelloides]MDT1012386.1 hypothetical protein [Plesiomonas shigelloides]QOH78371.1 hypothetical protein IHE26_07780 [Plesiomonas shigelloides]
MDNDTLETLLVAQIATLAHQIKQAKAARGTTTTDTCVGEAVRLIKNQRSEILRKLSETR